GVESGELEPLEGRLPGGAGAHRLAAEHERHRHVLQCGHGGERARDLVRAGQAHLDDPVGRAVRDVLAVEDDLSAVRLVVAAEDVDQSRLPGPVGADETDDLAFADVAAHPIEGVDATEMLDEVLEAEVSHRPPPRSPGRRALPARAAAGDYPPGSSPPVPPPR